MFSNEVSQVLPSLLLKQVNIKFESVEFDHFNNHANKQNHSVGKFEEKDWKGRSFFEIIDNQ